MQFYEWHVIQSELSFTMTGKYAANGIETF